VDAAFADSTEKLTVIGPDLAGIGGSSIPADRLDRKTPGIRIAGRKRTSPS